MKEIKFIYKYFRISPMNKTIFFYKKFPDFFKKYSSIVIFRKINKNGLVELQTPLSNIP
jgi:hypothetical protein